MISAVLALATIVDSRRNALSVTSSLAFGLRPYSMASFFHLPFLRTLDAQLIIVLCIGRNSGAFASSSKRALPQ